jgi:hypothetical protein
MPEAVDASSGASSSLTDAIGIGTLTRLLPRELVDEVVLSLGRREQRKNKLPARVVVYFVMALALFYGDSYEEVMRKLASGLDYLGTWRRDWEVPTPGALCHARKRLGPEVMQELYKRVSVPCAMRSTKGAWLAGRRLMACPPLRGSALTATAAELALQSPWPHRVVSLTSSSRATAETARDGTDSTTIFTACTLNSGV